MNPKIYNIDGYNIVYPVSEPGTVVVYKQKSFLDAGIIYAPYIPIYKSAAPPLPTDPFMYFDEYLERYHGIKSEFTPAYLKQEYPELYNEYMKVRAVHLL